MPEMLEFSLAGLSVPIDAESTARFGRTGEGKTYNQCEEEIIFKSNFRSGNIETVYEYIKKSPPKGCTLRYLIHYSLTALENDFSVSYSYFGVMYY